ncbi:hypothetical protein AV903_15005 [Erwinia tracheiphila]|uniref:Uncharacterized protein n=1 Tax=Erwinia tracheiphila TaxID=65700 RepID=A0A345CUB5_9GAMM|nr:hypothetical protein AV903_15005 [Erwinia tracheiphila]
MIIKINIIKSINKNDKNIAGYTHPDMSSQQVISTTRKGYLLRRGQDERFPPISKVMNNVRQ